MDNLMIETGENSTKRDEICWFFFLCVEGERGKSSKWMELANYYVVNEKMKYKKKCVRIKTAPN